MTDCRRAQERMGAYVDESLPLPERADVERHLDECPPCRDDAGLQRDARDVLRACAERLRGQELPPGLRSRCEAILQEHAPRPAHGWRARPVPVVLAAVLLVFTASALLSLATKQSSALLAAQLGIDHARCFDNHVAADAPGLDAASVEAGLEAQTGGDVHVPASSDAAGVRLVHARRCLYVDGRVPHVLYHARGEAMSLFILEGVTRPPADLTTFGRRARIWTRGNTTFVLISAEDAGNVESAARYVMAEAR